MSFTHGPAALRAALMLLMTVLVLAGSATQTKQSVSPLPAATAADANADADAAEEAWEQYSHPLPHPTAAATLIADALSGDITAAIIGAEGEYSGKETPYLVTCRIHTLTEEYLSFTVTKSGALAPAFGETVSYNIHRPTGKCLLLSDIFGEDYARVLWQELEGRISSVQTRFDDSAEAAALLYEGRGFYIEEDRVVILFDGGELTDSPDSPLRFPVPLPCDVKIG